MPAFAQYLIDQKQAVGHTFQVVADPIDVRHVLMTNDDDDGVTHSRGDRCGACDCGVGDSEAVEC